MTDDCKMFGAVPLKANKRVRLEVNSKHCAVPTNHRL